MTTRLGPFPARVIGAEPLGGLALVRVELGSTEIGAPGQFHMVRNATGRDYLPRPVGLIPLADGGVGMLVDPASAAGDLAGPELQLLGPLGVGFDLEHIEPEVTLVVAAGFGITVFPGLTRVHSVARLISGFRQSDHAAALELVAGVTCDAPIIAPEVVTGAVEEALATGEYRQLLVAGPSGLGVAVAALAERYGVASQVALEAPMACGFGACFGCAVEIDGVWKRCCIEGPVVDGARLVAA